MNPKDLKALSKPCIMRGEPATLDQIAKAIDEEKAVSEQRRRNDADTQVGRARNGNSIRCGGYRILHKPQYHDACAASSRACVRAAPHHARA